ncbi:MAG: cytoplasmic protein [Desulfobacterales bacterium]|nr:MAG: cytoplasmic protein [Desulfobacterales bacterium]
MEINLKLDGNNLYREESFTDLKVGAIRKLTPVTADGSLDENRDPIFMAHTQLMSPDGPFPVSCLINSKTLPEAVEKFPDEMSREVKKMMDAAQKTK